MGGRYPKARRLASKDGSSPGQRRKSQGSWYPDQVCVSLLSGYTRMEVAGAGPETRRKLTELKIHISTERRFIS